MTPIYTFDPSQTQGHSIVDILYRVSSFPPALTTKSVILSQFTHLFYPLEMFYFTLG